MDTKAIVVVEDNKAIARLIQEVLNDVPGYGAVTVSHGAAALEVISEIQADLVVLDIDLPGINGFEIYDRLRAHPATAGVPVLFMSAAMHEDELAERGFHEYLHKPFDLDDLLARVAATFGRPRSPDDVASGSLSACQSNGH
jgi:DNA-binding response OmpR family regulator